MEEDGSNSMGRIIIAKHGATHLTIGENQDQLPLLHHSIYFQTGIDQIHIDRENNAL